jgi:branched-chain amino acid transport system substrate-binding protein
MTEHQADRARRRDAVPGSEAGEPTPQRGLDESIPRREFVRRAGATSLALGSGGLLAACGVKSNSSSSGGSGGGGGGGTLKIGYVSPLTGEAASFGESDTYVLGQVRKAIAGGITGSGGKHYTIQIVQKDSQSSPQTASSVANDLINSAQIDLMLTTSTPEVVNPVSDACEAAGIPCISTVVPWESWYFGRGAKPTNKAAFKYTYHFSFGVENFAAAYISQWHLLPTNKVVGALDPNDSDGNAIRMGLLPLLTKAGFKVIDAGPYNDGLNDFSAQIAKFKANNCQIFNTFPLPPDFATFWRQAAQQGYKPIIAQIAKTGLFPSQVEALGNLGPTLATAAYWHPAFPYTSSLTGLNGTQIKNGYEATGKQWTQQLGSDFALWDAGVAALKHAPNPKDKLGLANSISTLTVQTPVGTIDWTKGPVKNVATDVLVGCQWVKAAPGSKFPLDLLIIEHAEDPKIPIQAKLKPYGAA